jgi:hypothetical protein
MALNTLGCNQKDAANRCSSGCQSSTWYWIRRYYSRLSWSSTSPIILCMSPLCCAKVMIKPARWLGVGILLAALPLSLMASIVAEEFSINVGTGGTGDFSYDTDHITADIDGPYADQNDGLISFDLTYGGITYREGDALDSTTLPVVYIPPNTTIPSGSPYGFLAAWVISGTCTPAGAGAFTCAGPGGVGGATIAGVGRQYQSFLYEDVTGALFDDSGSFLRYTFGVDPVKIYGTVSETAVPEPALIPVLALGLAGLYFARRRKAIL